MAVATQQQLGEIIELADMSVRVASQLRMAKKGLNITDIESLERAKDYLSAAIEGGQFISTGNAGNFQSSLRPFTWAADIRLPSAFTSKEAQDQIKDYETIVEFLSSVRDILATITSEDVPGDRADIAINFFQSLGNNLGVCADQNMRYPSNAFATSLLR